MRLTGGTEKEKRTLREKPIDERAHCVNVACYVALIVPKRVFQKFLNIFRGVF